MMLGIWPCVEIQVEIGYGQYHNSNWMRGIFANGMTLVKIQVMADRTIPCNHIGTMRSGFQATAPKMTGSLMFRMPGPKQALPKALS